MSHASFASRRAVWLAAAVATALLAAACSTGASSTASPSAAVGSTRLPSASPSSGPSGTSAVITAPIVGYWHRAQSCEELLATFEAAGLAQSHSEWLQGNFFGGQPAPTGGELCVGAAGPLEHSHWFTEDGGFGSHDENREQVDGGDYVVIDADTVSFPSHAAEFGYAGDILVDYTIEGDTLTFDVRLPAQCDAACKDAYAWALSAFSSGSWAPGDVP